MRCQKENLLCRLCSSSWCCSRYCSTRSALSLYGLNASELLIERRKTTKIHDTASRSRKLVTEHSFCIAKLPSASVRNLEFHATNKCRSKSRTARGKENSFKSATNCCKFSIRRRWRIHLRRPGYLLLVQVRRIVERYDYPNCLAERQAEVPIHSGILSGRSSSHHGWHPPFLLK
jgi:hypothetical protein